MPPSMVIHGATGDVTADSPSGGKWIKGAIKHPGSLHTQLHVKQGAKIPGKKLQDAMSGTYGPLAKKRAVLEKTLKGFK
jgi:hypothetical protein